MQTCQSCERERVSEYLGPCELYTVYTGEGVAEVVGFIYD